MTNKKKNKDTQTTLTPTLALKKKKKKKHLLPQTPKFTHTSTHVRQTRKWKRKILKDNQEEC